MTNPLSDFLQSRIEAKDFPSAAYLVAEKGEIVLKGAVGFAVVEPFRIKARVETVYDVASLTKVLITGLLAAKAIEEGEMNLSDRIEKFLPDYDAADKRGITIENLLMHTSGFPAWLPFYLFYDLPKIERHEYNKDTFPPRRNLVRQKISETPLENARNTKVVYSDLNFITLGFILEKIYNQPLAEIAWHKIFFPLNLMNTQFRKREIVSHLQPEYSYQIKLEDIAASEKGNVYEKQTCIDLGYDVGKYEWREDGIWGDVHDGNCWFMGGVSGHAGIFSNVADTFKIAQQFLANQSTFLKPETCELFRKNFTPNLNEARSIAFQLAETPDSTGKFLAKDSFGHLGFTGTALWIEPETERIFILFTNRTHARPLPFENINSVRREFNRLAAMTLSLRGKGESKIKN